MRRDILEIDASWNENTWEPELTLADVESIRLLLGGGSVVDWQRLAMPDLQAVDAFLTLHGMQVTNEVHQHRLRFIYNEAVSYLEEHLKLHFPRELRAPDDVRIVFLWASQFGGFRRRQILSCVILKLMHVIHHLAAAELRHRISISEAELLAMAHQSILHGSRAMTEQGLPVVSFTGNRKSRSSVITKLLAKRDNLAAQLFDKLRYRCVVKEPEDVQTAIAWMTRNLFPFNYVLPGQSHNTLLDPELLSKGLTEEDHERVQILPQQQPEIQLGAKNEFSGASYRIVNFIIDFPLPLPPSRHPYDIELGNIVFINLEMQVLDEATARNNEIGENAHHLYKQRQDVVVAQRLKRGGWRR